MKKLSEKEAEILSTTALAYLGDAVWELAVRQRLLDKGLTHVDRLQKSAVGYVSAEAQCRIMEMLLDFKDESKDDAPFLSEEELSLVRRAKNHKLVASKKNSKKSVMTDKYATAFEALVGYVYLKDDRARLESIAELSFSIAEETL